MLLRIWLRRLALAPVALILGSGAGALSLLDDDILVLVAGTSPTASSIVRVREDPANSGTYTQALLVDDLPSDARGIAVAPGSGTIYVAAADEILIVDPDTESSSNWFGGGPSSRFSDIQGITTDASGNPHVVDRLYSVPTGEEDSTDAIAVVGIFDDGGLFADVITSSLDASNKMGSPTDIAITFQTPAPADGDVFVSEEDAFGTPSPMSVVQFSDTDAQSVLAPNDKLSDPQGISNDRNGGVVVADPGGTPSVVRVDSGSGDQVVVSETGPMFNPLLNPVGIDAESSTSFVVADSGVGGVVRVQEGPMNDVILSSGGLFTGGTVTDVAVVPEPGTGLMLALGLAALAARRSRA